MNIAESNRGRLSAIDISEIPFQVKRIFIVDRVQLNGIRSEHAHIRDNQMLYCLNGSLKIKLTDTNLDTKYYILKQTDSLMIPKLTWSVITFLDPESSLICFCSENYDEKEYIRDYNIFITKFSKNI